MQLKDSIVFFMVIGYHSYQRQAKSLIFQLSKLMRNDCIKNDFASIECFCTKEMHEFSYDEGREPQLLRWLDNFCYDYRLRRLYMNSESLVFSKQLDFSRIELRHIEI